LRKSKHISCSIIPLPPENHAVYEIEWKNIVQATDDNMAQALPMMDT